MFVSLDLSESVAGCGCGCADRSSSYKCTYLSAGRSLHMIFIHIFATQSELSMTTHVCTKTWLQLTQLPCHCFAHTSAGISWRRHQNLKQFTSYDEGTQEVSRLLSCTTTACLLLVNNLLWMHQWPIRQPSNNSSTTQQSWNLILASELFQVLISASTELGPCTRNVRNIQVNRTFSYRMQNLSFCQK